MKTMLRSTVIVLALAVFCLQAPAREASPKLLVFAGYPNTAEFLIARVLREVGNAYEEANPGVKIQLRTGQSWWQSRNQVLAGEADAIMISEKLNRYRAYRSQSGPTHRGFVEMEVDRFIPVAVRVIRSENKVLNKMRLGIATNRISPELKKFLDFLESDEAKKIISAMQDMEPAEIADEPTPDHRGLGRGKEVKLERPILRY